MSASPRLIRQSNLAAALGALFAQGGLSRADLARGLALNRSSAGAIVAELIARGLVAEGLVGEGLVAERGRPAIGLELVGAAALFLGLEIGVEHIASLVMDLRGEILAHQTQPFDGRVVSARAGVAAALAQGLALLSPAQIAALEGIGLSAPAQMRAQGQVMIAPILGWRAVDLLALARESLAHLAPDLAALPVSAENDANAFAFGESYRNSAARAGVTLALVIESGVGGGVLIEGRLFRGAHGLAGEIGHMVVQEGAQDVALEEVLGLDHLAAAARRAGLAQQARPDQAFAELLMALMAGQPQAAEIARDWARHLARAIVTAARILDPDRVVLGGAVCALYPFVARDVAQAIAELQPETFPDLEIVLHDTADLGAAYGAAALAHAGFLSAGFDRPSEPL